MLEKETNHKQVGMHPENHDNLNKVCRNQTIVQKRAVDTEEYRMSESDECCKPLFYSYMDYYMTFTKVFNLMNLTKTDSDFICKWFQKCFYRKCIQYFNVM